ncbi:MAG: hypothetical protein U1F52_21925 [Burkholderiales bacterium]
MKTKRQWIGIPMLAAAGSCLVGCTATQFGPAVKIDSATESFMQAMTPAERSTFERLYQEGERNAVLNYNELGLAALEAGHHEMAETAFGEAIQRIERVYADDPNAKKAKSVWAEERVKDFKGEPYERSMAYYYRGLVFLRKGDFQNARASFLSAEFQDTVAEKEEYQSDFALMNYLAAWSSACDGDADRAQGLMKVATEKDAAFAPLSATRPVLFLFESGKGPVKNASGKHRELLVFDDPAPAVFTPKQISVAGRTDERWVKGGDVAFQAMTRGGRPVQAILDGKAQWKDGTQQVGDALVTAGTMTAMSGAMSNNSDMAAAGGYAALIGLAFDIASQGMRAGADTRQWSSLPRDIYVMEWDQPVQGSDAEVSYVKADAEGGVSKLQWLRPEGACQIAWGRAPDTQGTPAVLRKLEPARGKRDDAFRQELLQKFASKGQPS